MTKKSSSENQPEPQEVPQQPVSQPQPQVQPQVSSTQGPASKNLKFIVLGIILIAAAVVGYGFWNGSQIKNYAVKGEKMANDVKDWNKLFDESGSAKEVKTSLDKVKADAEKNLAELEKTKAPGKAKELESNLKEYFTVAKKLATELQPLIDWAFEMEELGNKFSNMDFDSSSPESITKSFKDAKEDLDKSIKNLKEVDMPSKLKSDINDMTETLEDLSDVFGDMIAALEAEDYEAMISIGTSMESDFSNLESFESFDKSIEDAYKDDKDKLDSLEKKINERVGTLKNTTFSF